MSDWFVQRVLQAHAKVKHHKEYTKESFSAYTAVVANANIEGGIKAKLKVFDSLQKNLYDVLEDNLKKTVFSKFYTVPDNSKKTKLKKAQTDRDLLNKVGSLG